MDDVLDVVFFGVDYGVDCCIFDCVDFILFGS